MLVRGMPEQTTGGVEPGPGAAPDGGAAALILAEGPPDLVRALDTIADLLAGLSGDRPSSPDTFYDRLCEAVCRLTSMRRAVIFRWDEGRRQVRAAGAHGIDIEIFGDDFLSVELVPATRVALERDEVVVSDDHPDVPERYGHLVGDRRMTVVPMVAGGRWIGVLLGDRLPDAPPVSAAERHLLWSLGKTAALAASARIATSQALRSRELERRIDLAREIHDGVVQRLFGVSLALSGGGPLDAQTRARCADELQGALQELREAVQRPLGRESRPTQSTLAEELRRLEREHAGLGVHLEVGDPSDVPRHLEALAQSVLIEAVRNAGKHAKPSEVAVRIERGGGTFVLDVVNDGVSGRQRRSGMGLRLAALEALHHGGVLEFGPQGDASWQVRLTVPDA